jgi:hypothetical protein
MSDYVHIVIVNYRTADLVVAECLRAFSRQLANLVDGAHICV